MDKKIIKFDDTEIEDKQQISIKQQYLFRFLSFNKILNISLVTEMIKKLYLYAYSIQKLVYMKEKFIKLDVCISQ